MSYCISSTTTFAWVTVSIPGALLLLATQCSGLKDEIRGVFENDVSEETDWRRGGGGPPADRSQDLTEQLAGPPQEYDDRISRRSKREQSSIWTGEDLVENRYKYVPDYNAHSPSPGPRLDDIIIEPNDGQYHGNTLKRKGATANLLFTTKTWTTRETTTESYTEGTLRPFPNNVEDLRMIQSRINRLKLNTTPAPVNKITRPLISWFEDPNFNVMHKTEDPVGSLRRMMGAGQMPATILSQKLMQLHPNVVFRPCVEIPPFFYNPLVQHNSFPTTPIIPIITDFLSPLQLFKLKYGSTKPRRIRTRKPKSKMTPAVSSMKEEEYNIPEESEEDDTNTTVIQNTPDESEMDEGTDRPNILRSETEDLNKDTTKEEQTYAPEVIDVKKFATHTTTPAYLKPNIFSMTQHRRLNAEPTPVGELEKKVQNEALNEEMKSITFSEAEDNETIIDKEVDNEPPSDTEPTPVGELEKKVQNEALNEEIKSLTFSEAEDNETIIDKEVDNEPPFDTDTWGFRKANKFSESKLDMASGNAIQKYLEGPDARRENMGEMNKELKGFLMSEAEEIPKQYEDFKNVDYDDVEDIRGIPIRKR